MTIESRYHKEFNALCEEYEAFGYIVLDDELKSEIKILNSRYQVK